jgi:hypothetical protein
VVAEDEDEDEDGVIDQSKKRAPPELALIASKDIIEAPTVTCKATPIA